MDRRLCCPIFIPLLVHNHFGAIRVPCRKNRADLVAHFKENYVENLLNAMLYFWEIRSFQQPPSVLCSYFCFQSAVQNGCAYYTRINTVSTSTSGSSDRIYVNLDALQVGNCSITTHQDLTEFDRFLFLPSSHWNLPGVSLERSHPLHTNNPKLQW